MHLEQDQTVSSTHKAKQSLVPIVLVIQQTTQRAKRDALRTRPNSLKDTQGQTVPSTDTLIHRSSRPSIPQPLLLGLLLTIHVCFFVAFVYLER
jgi:hypothetical protein